MATTTTHTVDTPWLTFREATAYLKVTEPTLRRYVADGTVQAHRIGRVTLRFSRRDLDAAMIPQPPGGKAE
jgi:excisionase family DNA binding protein